MPDGAVPNAVDGVVTVTSWERKVVVDLTRPTITSLLLASATNPDEGPVVRDSERAKVRFVASEPLAVSGPNPPNVRLVTEDCSGAIISAVTATTLVAGTDSTYEVGGNVAVDDTALGGATCEMSRVCVQIPSATDRGENALVNDEICNGFGALLTNAQPGWLFFDNAVAPSASALTLEKVPASCADSSVGSADCLALSTTTPLGPGSWFKAQLRAATLTAVRQVVSATGRASRTGHVYPPRDPIWFSRGASTRRRRRSARRTRRVAARARRFCAPTARFDTAATNPAATARRVAASPRSSPRISPRRISRRSRRAVAPTST